MHHSLSEKSLVLKDQINRLTANLRLTSSRLKNALAAYDTIVLLPHSAFHTQECSVSRTRSYDQDDSPLRTTAVPAGVAPGGLAKCAKASETFRRAAGGHRGPALQDDTAGRIGHQHQDRLGGNSTSSAGGCCVRAGTLHQNIGKFESFGLY